MTPEEITLLQTRLNEFLEVGGAKIMAVTNEFEVARFISANGTCVIYRNKKGVISYSNEHAEAAFQLFLRGKPWSATKVHNRVPRKTIEAKLLERDGDDCFFCFVKFSEAVPPTLEHLLAINNGGNNHIANLCLACEPCNVEVGSMHIAEKMKIRERNRDRMVYNNRGKSLQSENEQRRDDGGEKQP